jgi:DNA-binding response OmpR family regulator
VLIVDDNAKLRQILGEALSFEVHCRVTLAPNYQSAAEIMKRDRPDAAIIDAMLPRGSGLGLAQRLIGAGIPVLLTSGHSALKERAKEIGCRFLSKPFPLSALIAQTRALLEDPPRARTQF